MADKPKNMHEIMNMDPFDLQEYLADLCRITMPQKIETIQEMSEAAKLMSTITGHYMYLSGLELRARMEKRMLKSNKCGDDLVEAMTMREEICGKYAKVLMQCYETISRMITVKQQINAELKMTGSMI